MPDQKNDYFDLTNESNSIDSVTVSQSDRFNCSLTSISTGEVLGGFILAKSPQGNRLTVCDVDFHKSETDGKFQPRFIFRRTRNDLQNVEARSGSESVRISFQHGDDGYREFWEMIFFLYKFKELIDVGDFDGRYQVVSRDQIEQYFGDKKNIESIKALAERLNVEVSAIMKPASTIKILKDCLKKLKYFIENNSTETEVLNWIDEDMHAYRRERCMIFGLEYIDFMREGHASSKRFDILTRVGDKDVERVLFELKCPSDDIFRILDSETSNGVSQEYHIHPKVARAIPQILEYKSTLESKDAGDPELTALGINEKIKICKCIIVVGKNSTNARWVQNRANLSSTLANTLEIWTYEDLQNKLESTIRNLEEVGSGG